MVLGVVLTILVSVVGGIATNIITDKWKVSGGGRAVAAVVVMLLIVAVGLAVAEETISGGDAAGPNTNSPTTSPATSPATEDSGPPTTSSTTDSPATDSPTTDPPTTDPPAGPKITKYWSGEFLLHQVTAVELDTKPASSATGPDNTLDRGDLFYDNREALGNYLYAADGPLAQWEGKGVPDAGSCLEAVQTLATGRVDPRAGDVLCVGTNGGRIARLQVEQAAYEGVRFAVTVWDVRS